MPIIHLLCDHYVTVTRNAIGLINENGLCILMSGNEFMRLLEQTPEIDVRIGETTQQRDISKVGDWELKIGARTYLLIESNDDTVSVLRGCRCDDCGTHPAMKSIKLRRKEWCVLLATSIDILHEQYQISEQEFCSVANVVQKYLNELKSRRCSA